MTLASKFTIGVCLVASTAVAESARNTSEDVFRAKFGRNTPAVEARQKAEAANTAYRDATPPKAARTENQWAEQRHQSKLGRPTPAEESRIAAEQANTAYRDVKEPAKDRWQDNYLRLKHGRPAPASDK